MSSMDTAAGRRTRRRCAIAVVAVLGLAATGPGGLPNPVGVEEASAAQWVGSMQGTAGKSSRCVSGGSTMRGDFSFTVGRGGQLRGFATAAYQPTFDTDRSTPSSATRRARLPAPWARPGSSAAWRRIN